LWDRGEGYFQNKSKQSEFKPNLVLQLMEAMNKAYNASVNES